jgi:hypothetical protein
MRDVAAHVEQDHHVAPEVRGGDVEAGGDHRRTAGGVDQDDGLAEEGSHVGFAEAKAAGANGVSACERDRLMQQLCTDDLLQPAWAG